MNIYSDNVNRFSEQKNTSAAQLSYISLLRLLLFIAFGWFLYSSFKLKFQGYDLIWSLLAICGFIASVFWADSVKKKIAILQQLILINENEIHIENGEASFLDNGSTLSPAKGFAVDLNLFGYHSLYHLLNRTGSRSGKQQLASHLANPFIAPADITNYQACVQEFSGKISFRQNLLAHTLLLKEEASLEQLKSKRGTDSFAILQNGFWSVLAIVWPVLGISLVAYSIYQDAYQLLLAFCILGLLILSFVLKTTSAVYAQVSKRGYLFGQYAICFNLISKEHFEHPYLLKKQKDINEASTAFRKLSKLVGLFDLRLSLFSFFLNGLFMHELICARACLKWNKQYQEAMDNWFATMGEIELLNSLATFHYNHPYFIFPQPQAEKLLITATAMGHPLMKESTAVVNDMEIGEQSKLHLITGSNMSGKSTFLRTLGLNIVLAQSGAPVFAKTFVFRPVRILSSFHHIDSLEESTSYFYAELKCLQEIIQSLTGPVPALVLLDEVMRGTNSKDKHDGTALLIKKILQFYCLSFIATHDTELGILSESYPGAVENFCFESELTDAGLHFDFTMRKGVAQTKNATYLMQQMGII
jgi:hypothetical protein